jgi:hypothetical protein
MVATAIVKSIEIMIRLKTWVGREPYRTWTDSDTVFHNNASHECVASI